MHKSMQFNKYQHLCAHCRSQGKSLNATPPLPSIWGPPRWPGVSLPLAPGRARMAPWKENLSMSHAPHSTALRNFRRSLRTAPPSRSPHRDGGGSALHGLLYQLHRVTSSPRKPLSSSPLFPCPLLIFPDQRPSSAGSLCSQYLQGQFCGPSTTLAEGGNG